MSYKVPLEFAANTEPYVQAMFLGMLRHTTVFNEVCGSIETFCNWLGIPIHTESGRSVDRCKNAIREILRADMLHFTVTQFNKLNYQQVINAKWKDGCGWNQRGASLGIVYKRSELDRAAQKAREKKWERCDDFAKILRLIAYLRLQMDFRQIGSAAANHERCGITFIEIQELAECLNVPEQRLRRWFDVIVELKLGRVEVLRLHSDEYYPKTVVAYSNDVTRGGSYFRRYKQYVDRIYPGFKIK